MKGKLLTEKKAIHKRWREYWTQLNNYKLKPEPNTLKNEDKIENNETGEAPILREEVEKAAQMPKNNKPLGVDNIQAKVLNHGGSGIINDLINCRA